MHSGIGSCTVWCGKKICSRVWPAQKDVDAHNVALDIEALSDADEYARGYVEGQYLHDKSILLGPRNLEQEAGYHLITPMQTLRGVILVNRGFVPLSFKSDRASVFQPEDSIKVTGMIMRPSRGNFMTPENRPEQGVWYTLDIETIQRSAQLSALLPYVLRAESESGAMGRPYPVYTPAFVKLNNNHAQYALFWFSMAIVLVLIFGLRFIVPQFSKRKS